LLFIYNISVNAYYLAIKIAFLFVPKAKAFVLGRKNIFKALKTIPHNENIYWFHCASLGELEQGKPVIESLKKTDSSIKVLITFFSPSGYKYGKDYSFADFVFYLPIDTQKNAKEFIELINPKKAFFIKYEFWYHYLFQLKEKNIPTFLISGVFRKNQLFFKWYGTTHREMLSFFTRFFVQNKTSEKLLNTLGYKNVSITGDTRLDRVYQNALRPEKPALIKKFVDTKKTIIIGSSWPEEEKIIASFIKSTNKDYKFIIAPHNIDEKRIKNIVELIKKDVITYSNATNENIAAYQTLVIDNIGILANTYQFTDIAFIGGGFSGSLHNILEPASFGNVILFGPKHDKFDEAEELLKINGAYNISDTDDLLAIINHLESDTNLKDFQEKNKNYIKNNKGATSKILKELN
jgi:3-deoxy-D-manno-octulosonic-acid transferase